MNLKRRHRLKNKSVAEIPIIAMTANAFKEDREKCLEVGMNEHVSKPIDVAQLYAILQTVLIKTKE